MSREGTPSALELGHLPERFRGRPLLMVGIIELKLSRKFLKGDGEAGALASKLKSGK